MTTTVIKPNIFSYATNELSQDVFVAWIIRWADPAFESVNPYLHSCGIDVLSLFLGDKLTCNQQQITKVQTGRQWNNIDIFVKVDFQSGNNIFLIIEDKTYSAEHSGQLERYKKIAGDWAGKRGYTLACAYFKTGSEQAKVLKAISEKGYLTVDRSAMLRCLNNHRHITDSFVADYVLHLQYLEEAHQAFLTTPPKDWNRNAIWKEWPWVGLYQYIESHIDIHGWHRVNNPSGGFWNLCLTWGQWQDFPVYIQIEQGDICYKIAVDIGRKNSRMTDIEANRVQDFVFRELLAFAKEKGADIRKPKRYAHTGKYRTFAVVPQDVWMGNKNTIVDQATILTSVKSNIEFYSSFILEMKERTYNEIKEAIILNEVVS